MRWLGLAGVLAAALGLTVAIGGLSIGSVEPPSQTGTVATKAPVTAMDQGRQVAHNSPQLAVDPTAESFVVAATRRDSPTFGCGLQVSGSGGHGWHSIKPVNELPTGAKTCYAPEVVFGPQGRMHYLFAGLHGRGNEPMGVFLTSSRDRGMAFTTPQQVLPSHNFSVRLAIDQTAGDSGRMYMAWLHATEDPPLGAMPPPPNPIKFAASTDGGESWSEPVRLNPQGQKRVAAPTMTVGPNGTVYVAYYDLKEDQRDYKGLGGPVYEDTWSLVLARSTDGGRTFETRIVDGAVRPVERVMLIFTMAPPALAAGPDGRVCLAWPDARRRNDRGDILARCSQDRGENWQGATRVNDDPKGADQRLPQLDFSANGRLDAIFLDNRHAPNKPFQHVYYAVSDDTGRSFTQNLRVTSHDSNARIGQRYTNTAGAEGKVEFGSRLGLLAREDHAVGMWPDTRNSRLNTKSQDLFAARITYPEADLSDVSPAVFTGGIVVIAGVVAGGIGLVSGRRGHADARSHAKAEEPTIDGHEDKAKKGEDGNDSRGVSTRGRRAWWMRRIGPSLAVAVAVTTAISLTGGSEPGPLPSDPPKASVRITESGLEHPKSVKPGRVVFQVTNDAEDEHRLSMLPMSDKEPPISEQLADGQAEVVMPFAGIGPLEPGETTMFAADLEPNARYAVADFTADPGRGWHGEIRTREMAKRHRAED